jgi:hypothetical protein
MPTTMSTATRNFAVSIHSSVEVSLDPIVMPEAPEMPIRPPASAGLSAYYAPNSLQRNLQLVIMTEKILVVERCNDAVTGQPGRKGRMVSNVRDGSNQESG